MITKDMARGMLEQAEAIFEEAIYLSQKQKWNLVVRRCQECVELSLKASLLYVGVEIPKIHDVGPLLKRYKNRFPKDFSIRITELASISRSLRAEREISFYGDEQSGIPPNELYTQDDAHEAIEKAKVVLEACKHLVEDENGE